MSIARVLLVLLGGFVLVVATPMLQAQEQQENQPEEKKKQERAEPIDFRKLREALPEKIAMLERKEAKGERIKTGELHMTIARGEYRAEETEQSRSVPSADLELHDYAAMPDALEGLAFWTQLEIDQEGDEGYQRTVKLQEKHPAFEQYRTNARNGEVQILVAERFFLNVRVRDVSEEQFKEVLKALPLDEIAELKK